MSISDRRRPLFDPPVVRRALVESVLKLDPRHQVRNPVMFTVLVCSALTTVLFTIVVVVTGGFFLGLGLGLLAGYRGGWVDTAIMRVMDVILAFPSLLLALVLVAILGPGLFNAMLACDDARPWDLR